MAETQWREVGPSANATAKERLSLLRERFLAWWEGYDYRPPRGGDGGGRAPSAPQRREVKIPLGWTDRRFGVVEGLWGQGFNSPGEAEHIKELIKPLGLNRKMTVLDINPGLGGTSRVIAEETSAWVVGLESDPELVRGGMERSVMAGMVKRAPIKLYTPPALGIRARSIDAVVSKEAFYAIEDKARMFRAIYDSLKPVGQFLFTDYVITRKGRVSPALVDWVTQEVPKPRPWRLEKTVKALKRAGFDLRIKEDVSPVVRDLVVKGWRQFLRAMAGDEVPPEERATVQAELNLWTRRLELMAANDISCVRFHALKREISDELR